MNISVGETYTLRDEGTGETAYLSVSELIESRGQWIVYGETRKYAIHVPATHGIVPVPARPSCFPIFPNATAEEVLRFMAQLNSRPIVMVLPDGRKLPVPNVDRTEMGKDRKAMMLRAFEMVQAFETWQGTGSLPGWYFRKLKQPAQLRS